MTRLEDTVEQNRKSLWASLGRKQECSNSNHGVEPKRYYISQLSCKSSGDGIRVKGHAGPRRHTQLVYVVQCEAVYVCWEYGKGGDGWGARGERYYKCGESVGDKSVRGHAR